MLNVLIACEESQRVCISFRELGHNAYSCDLQECSGGHPEWHICGSVLPILNGGNFTTMDNTSHHIDKWDIIVAHPPCTYLSCAATSRHSLKSETLDNINKRTLLRIDAMEFFMVIANANCNHIAIENPTGVMNTCYRQPDQIISPYMFATTDDERLTKRTCLWLKNLPTLKHKDNPKPNNGDMWGLRPDGSAYCWIDRVSGGDRAKIRSKTFYGIAHAMATQWSEYVEKQYTINK